MSACQSMFLVLALSLLISSLIHWTSDCGPHPLLVKHFSPYLPHQFAQSTSQLAAVQQQRLHYDPFPFRFPRYNSSTSAHPDLYLTSWPNHGAGVGHQFGEWLTGAALSFRYNLSYVHTPFLVMSAKWTDYLGFGFGEQSKPDLDAHYDEVTEHILEIDREAPDDWIKAQIALYDQEQADKPLRQSSELAAASPPHAQVYQKTSARLLRLNRIHVPMTPHTRNLACTPELNLLLRRKYCLARLRDPMRQDLYREDRLQSRFVVALHMRCGDSCYNIWRATNLDSVRRTVTLLVEMLSSAPLGVPQEQVSFHLFSQSPPNDTAATHFAPVVQHIRTTTRAHVATHFDVLGITTLHHMVQSDLLLGAQSSFSWIASLLHHGAVIGPIPNCETVVNYDRITGEFDAQQLTKALAEYKQRPRLESLQDCYDMKPLLE